MTFNKDEIETLDRLLKDAEKYVGQEESLNDDSDTSMDNLHTVSLGSNSRQ